MSPVRNPQAQRITKYLLTCIATAFLFTTTSVPKCFGQGVTAEFYQSEIQSTNQTGVLLMKNYVRGALDGIQFANALLRSNNQTPIFCPPENFGLGTSNATQIIDYEIKTMPEMKNANITVLLLLGLQRAFPCSK